LAVIVTLGLVAACAVALWKLSADAGEPPAPADSAAWTWISSVPGANVYVHEMLPAPVHPRVWFDFKSNTGPASINADLMELWEFDCQTGRGRRVAGPFRFPEANSELQASRDPGWRAVAPQTVLGKMKVQVCPSSISAQLEP
jgi:hypothetical protein